MHLLSTLVAAGGIAAATITIDETAFAPEDIITKDLAIIGGGASGTYAAVRLREDLDTSIVLIEKTDHLVSRPTALVLRTLISDRADM